MAEYEPVNKGRLSDSDLQTLLMERAERLHECVRWKIPESLRSQLSADDVLQDVWVAAFRGLPGFRANHPGALDRWLTTIADRKLLDAIRTARRVKRGGLHRIENAGQRRRTSRLDLFGLISSGQRTPSSEQGAREVQHAVQIAVGALPDNYRQAVTLFHLQGRSRAEVAHTMKTTASAVHGLLYRALGRLRVLLGPGARFFSDDHMPGRSSEGHGAASA